MNAGERVVADAVTLEPLDAPRMRLAGAERAYIEAVARQRVGERRIVDLGIVGECHEGGVAIDAERRQRGVRPLGDHLHVGEALRAGERRARIDDGDVVADHARDRRQRLADMDRAGDDQTRRRHVHGEEHAALRRLGHAALAGPQPLPEHLLQRIAVDRVGRHQPLVAARHVGDHDGGASRRAFGIEMTKDFELHDNLWPVSGDAPCIYSTFSTNTRMVPPQDRPTFQAVSSATPNSSIFGLPLSITSIASVTTAPSTQPPDTEPRKLPSWSMTRLEPTGRGAEPQVSITVASATPRPALRQSSAALRMSSSRASVSMVSLRRLCHPGRRPGPISTPNIVVHATFCSQALGSAPLVPSADNARTSACIDSRLWIGRSSSTCGSIERMPLALASKPAKRNSGLSQMSRRQERCRRSISNSSRSPPSRSSPSVIKSTTAPCVSTRRAHCLLKARSEVAIRVPPDQSATLAETAASASSGSLRLSARVTLVSRVPNRNVCTRLRASVTA